MRVFQQNQYCVISRLDEKQKGGKSAFSYYKETAGLQLAF